MSNLDKAREWAKNYAAGEYCPGIDGPGAAAEIIQSLPEQWADVEEVKAIIEEMNEDLEAELLNDYGQGYNYATRHWREALEALLTPKLPTLADMTQEEREAMVGKDVTVEGWNNPSMLIAVHKNEGAVLGHDWINPWPFVEVRSLSELSPASEDEPTVSEQGNVAPDQSVAKDACNKSSLKPEEVPHSEPWLIEVNGWKALGTRYAWYTKKPWTVASLNGLFSGDYIDSEITLIHKLVPETHALPEGMRLADHPDFGRVVVSPWADDDEEYKVFYRDEDLNAGAGSYYAKKRKLTFLDGGDNE